MPKPAHTQPTDQFARFVKADSPIKQRIIAASFGEVGTLKTSFWLGAPGPIVIQSLDKGLEGVVEEYQALKDIYVAEYDWKIQTELSQEEAQELCATFEHDFEHALKHARTVVWDKETDVWSLFRFAEFGPEEAGKPKDWDKLKQRLRRLVNMSKSTDVNFGLIQAMRNEWIPAINKKTGAKGIAQSGERIRAGMDDIEALVHVNIEHAFEDDKFVMKVGKARGPGGREIQNTTLPAMTFPEFAMLVFPESNPADWE